MRLRTILQDGEAGPQSAWPRFRGTGGEADIDLTPMIDVVFQLLIFFLLTASLAAQQSVQVPEAEHGVGIDPAAATYITLSQAPQGNGRATVLLGDGKGGAATNDAEVRHWIVQGRNQNRNLVVLKAEGHVFHGDVRRVAQIVAGVEGVSLHVAVREKP